MNMTLPKQFFLGGNATFTVENGKGDHFTFKIRQPKSDTPFFVSVLSGPDNETCYSYMGVLNPQDAQIRSTAKSKVTPEATSFKVAEWALKKVWNQESLPQGYQIRHAGKCGCCGRTLTEPTSLTIGIGPECRKKLGI